MRVRFGDFVFDSLQRELRAGSEIVHLTPKGFLLLEALLQARPRPLSKEYLYAELWPETFVGDTNLKMLVSVLRTVLGENARDPQWIKTVYGFGYAFAGEGVVDVPPRTDASHGEITFQLIIGSRVVPLHPGANVLGRDDDSSIVIDAASVSRRHAVVVIRGDDALIEDLGSKNGTFVGSRRIEAPATLKDGARIRLGTVAMTFSAQLRGSSTVTDHFSTRS